MRALVFADPTRQLDQIAAAPAIEDIYDKRRQPAFEHDFLPWISTRDPRSQGQRPCRAQKCLM